MVKRVLVAAAVAAAAMLMIAPVSAQQDQTAREHRGFPIRLRKTGRARERRPKPRMPAFGHQHDFGAPLGNRLADQRLAVGIALGRIDHVDTGVECGIQDFIDRLLRDGLIANLRTAKSKSANAKPGLSKNAILDCHKNESKDYWKR